MAEEIEKELLRHTNLVKKEMKYAFQGMQGEVDVLAVIDQEIFIFECKASLTPGDLRQNKTCLDYIEKARLQLERFLAALKDESFKNDLQKRLGWKFPELYRPATCIVMSNRIFSGYRHGGHPVRGAGELLCQIRDGIISTNQQVKCLWPNGIFSGEHLWNYIEKDLLHAPYVSTLTSSDLIYRYGDKNILSEEYQVTIEDPERFFTNL